MKGSTVRSISSSVSIIAEDVLEEAKNIETNVIELDMFCNGLLKNRFDERVYTKLRSLSTYHNELESLAHGLISLAQQLEEEERELERKRIKAKLLRLEKLAEIEERF